MNSWLKKGSLYSIIIKIEKSHLSNIMLGVCSSKIFGKFNTRKEEEHLTCDLQSATIWKKGESVHKNEGMRLSEGDYVEMKVNLVMDEVKWLRQKEGKGEY